MTASAISQMMSPWTVADAMRADIRAWMPEYLAELERQEHLDPRTIPHLRSVVVRHAGIVRAEEQLPALIVWIANESQHTYDVDGGVYGDLGIGVLILAGAKDEASTGELLHRYATAAKQLLWDRPPAAGYATNLELTDGDYRGIEVVSRGRTLLGVDLSYTAKSVYLGSRGSYIPAGTVPREDPYAAPLPLPPTATSTKLTLGESRADPIDPED